MQEHLDDCESCARYLEVEDSFLQTLKGRLVEEEVPEGLEGRIREALEGEAPSTAQTPRGWLWSPVTATLAAAMILLAILVPTLREGSGVDSGAGTGEVVPIRGRVVTIVDEDCDRAGAAIEYQRGCENDRHLNALKVADGVYWHVSIDSPQAKEIVFDPGQRGRRVVVEATYYPEINTVKLIDVQDLVAMSF
jgi:hypothetical protein